MEHTSAMFRAVRERVGLSQEVIHDRLGVNVRTVKRWEDPRYPDPPEAAWDLLEDALEAHRKAVGAALEAVDRMAREAGHRPERVAVLYYRSQYQYDRFGRDRGGDWMVVDARARETAVRLEEKGIETVFYYPEENQKLHEVLKRTRRVRMSGNETTEDMGWDPGDVRADGLEPDRSHVYGTVSDVRDEFVEPGIGQCEEDFDLDGIASDITTCDGRGTYILKAYEDDDCGTSAAWNLVLQANDTTATEAERDTARRHLDALLEADRKAARE